MRIDKSNIRKEDIPQATKVLNRLRMRDFVFGNPAEGLKQTLIDLEKKLEEHDSQDGWVTVDKQLKSQIAKTKAGINGEQDLASFLQKEIKENQNLDGSIAFTSLSIDNIQNEELDYTPDSDFLFIHGDAILILDAKNITTNPELPVYIHGNKLMAVDKELLEVKPSTYVWRNYLNKKGVEYSKIEGCIVIINKSGCTIWKNEDWYQSQCKPIFIGELKEFLENWVETVNNKTISLNMLTQIANTQIKKETSGIDLSKALKKFKI